MTTRATTPEDDHYFRVEITVAGCIGTPEDKVLGDNMADVTMGFSMSMQRPPDGTTDVEINRAITHNMSPIVAAIQTVMTVSLGFATLGQIDEPMTDHSSPTGQFGRSTPVTVRISMSDLPAIHD